MTCSPLDPLSYGSCAAQLARSVAGDAFASIARSFGQAARAATGWLWGQLDTATAVSLGGHGFATVTGIVAAIAGVVAVGLFVLQILQSALRREPAGLARAVRGLLVAFLAGGAAVGVVDLLLAATDSLSAGVVHAAVGTDPAGLGRLVLGSAATATLIGAVSGPGGAAGVLLLALAILAAVVIVYAALVVRKVLIVLTAAFAPLAFAGSLADITVAWTRRWIELTAALIFSKLILVLIFLVGYLILIAHVGQAGGGATQAITQVVAGTIVLALAGFAPWLALRVVHFTGEHAGQLHALGTASTGGVAAAGRMAHKAVPYAGKGLALTAAPMTAGPTAAAAGSDPGSGPPGPPPRPGPPPGSPPATAPAQPVAPASSPTPPATPPAAAAPAPTSTLPGGAP